MNFIILNKKNIEKYFWLIFSIIAIIVLAVILPQRAKETFGEISCRTNEGRNDFLISKGIMTEDEPFEVSNVIIPLEFNSIMDDYNNLQLSQGYDLKKYTGCTVKRYTYRVLNYPDSANAYASLYIYDGEVIAADIYTAGLGGEMHGIDYLSLPR